MTRSYQISSVPFSINIHFTFLNCRKPFFFDITALYSDNYFFAPIILCMYLHSTFPVTRKPNLQVLYQLFYSWTKVATLAT